MDGEDLEEAPLAARPSSGLTHKCACCLLILLLPAGAAAMAFSAWRSEARAETDAVRARLMAQWDRPDLDTPPMKPEVDQLLDIALECERLEVSDALHNLRGSDVTHVRIALKHPSSVAARVTYEPESPKDPPTLLGAIAALRSATASIDESLDSLVDWEAIADQRLRQALRSARDNPDWDRYMAISRLSYQLRDRAVRASLAGERDQAWLEIDHLAQVNLLLGEPTSLFTHMVTRNQVESLVAVILAQLTEAPPPDIVARRLNERLLRLEEGLDPRRPLLGGLLQSEESLRAEPDEAVAVAIKPPGLFQKPEVTLESRAKGLVILDGWIRDYLLRGEALLDAAAPHSRLLDLLAEAEGICSSPGTPFAKTFHANYPKTIKSAIRGLALLRMARLAIAISRKEEPPLLQDPWSEEKLPLRWEERQDGRLWIWSQGPDRKDNRAGLSEYTIGAEEDEYPFPVLEQDPGSDVFGEEDENVDLVRAIPLGR